MDLHLPVAVRSVVLENTMDAWIKLLLLPKCCLPSSKRKGRNNKPYDISALCSLCWSRGQFGTLWHFAVSNSKAVNHKVNRSESI